MKQILKRALALILTFVMLIGTMTLFSCSTSGDKHTTITYSVKVVFADDFNFNTSEGSLVREIASFLGSALFEDFRWTATAEFTLILPYSTFPDGL